MIELSENKLEKLSENMEKGIRFFGKAMTCIDEMQQSAKKKSRMHERYGSGGGGNYNSRYGGGNMGQRDDDDWDEDEDFDDDEMNERYTGGGNMGERRGVKGTGPYSRYRYRR